MHGVHILTTVRCSGDENQASGTGFTCPFGGGVAAASAAEVVQLRARGRQVGVQSKPVAQLPGTSFLNTEDDEAWEATDILVVSGLVAGTCTCTVRKDTEARIQVAWPRTLVGPWILPHVARVPYNACAGNIIGTARRCRASSLGILGRLPVRSSRLLRWCVRHLQDLAVDQGSGPWPRLAARLELTGRATGRKRKVAAPLFGIA